LYIPGGAGYQPSTVAFKLGRQQNEELLVTKKKGQQQKKRLVLVQGPQKPAISRVK